MLIISIELACHPVSHQCCRCVYPGQIQAWLETQRTTGASLPPYCNQRNRSLHHKMLAVMTLSLILMSGHYVTSRSTLKLNQLCHSLGQGSLLSITSM
jgi:hypothetical protein